VFYVRIARLFGKLKIAHGDGGFRRRLAKPVNIVVLTFYDRDMQDRDQAAVTISSKCLMIA